jgi:hypothetical protein
VTRLIHICVTRLIHNARLYQLYIHEPCCISTSDFWYCITSYIWCCILTSYVLCCISTSDIFLDGYCSTVQGLLDWFEVDLGFTKLCLVVYSDWFVYCMFFRLLHQRRGACPAHEFYVHFYSFWKCLCLYRKKSTNIHVCACACVCVRLHIYIHTHIYVYIYIYIYIYRCVHTHQ